MGTLSLVIKGLGSVNRLSWKHLLRELLLTVLSLTLYEKESPDSPPKLLLDRIWSQLVGN